MKKTFQRVIASAVIGLVGVASFPVSAYESERIIFTESFNSYATNAEASSLDISGKKCFVEEYAPGEKGLALDLSSGQSEITIAAGTSEAFFVSMDISATGAVKGSLAATASSGKLTLLEFKNGRVCTHNGREISGLGKNMQNLVLAVNPETSSYSVYIQGHCKCGNYYFSSLKDVSITNFKLSLSSDVGAKVILDNINVVQGEPSFQTGGGTTIRGNAGMSGLPEDEYNPDVDEKFDPAAGITDDVYMNYDFAEKGRFIAKYHGKDNTLTRYTDEDGNDYCKFERTGSQDFHLDVTIASYPSYSLVYEYDLQLLSSDVQINSTFKSNTSNYFSHFTVAGGVLKAGNEKMTLEVGKWYTVSMLYDVLNGKYSVYVDYKPLAENLSVPVEYNESEADIWRVHVNRFSGADTFNIDNMKIYGADKPHDNVGEIDLVISDSQRAYEKDTAQKNLLKDKVSYHLRSGVLYANGEKTLFEPVVKNDVNLVPLEFFKAAFGSTVSFDETSGIGTVDDMSFSAGSNLCTQGERSFQMSLAAEVIDGKLYVPLRSVAVDGMKKKAYVDDSTLSDGMMILSDKTVSFGSGVDMQKLNDFAFYLRPNAETIAADYEASSLKGVHPRVMASEADFDRVRQLSQTDDNMISWSKAIVNQANGLVDDPTPLIYELRDGVRLWYVSLDFIKNMTVLGMAYQLTGDKAYAERAWVDLESVANFPNWHPDHHIDVGGMAVGYAVGYDWMYDAFTDEQRKVIETGAYYNGFFEYIDGYQGRSVNMKNGVMYQANHNMVMNAGGAMLGAAFMDIYPEASAYCISESIRCLEEAIWRWAPEGSWFEGIGYGGMTVEYMSYQLSTIKTLLGTVYTLDDVEGLDKAAQFFVKLQSPQGAFPYGDGSGSGITYDPGSLWFCDHYGDYETITAHYKMLGISASVRAMLWYRPEQVNSEGTLPLDSIYNDQNVITMRDTWNKDEQTVFAGLKGGQPGAAHGHMDVGKFEFYANGVQWTIDLGADDYNLPQYWGSAGIDGPRWKYYRMRGESHSTLIIDPDELAEFDPAVNAALVRTESKPRGAIGVLDTTDSHYGKAKKAQRGAYLADERRSLVIRDEVKLTKESTLYWSMQTKQKAEISEDGKSVILRESSNPDNYVTLDFACNEDFTITVGPCEPLPTSPHPDGIADDSDKTQIRVTIVSDSEVNLTAKFTPCTVENGADISTYDIPMADWTIPDGEIPELPHLDSLSIDGVSYTPSSKIINHILSGSEKKPEIVATSEKYDIAVNEGESGENATIVVSDKENAKNFVTYKITYTVLGSIGIEGLEELSITKLEASAEPQPENPVKSLIDRNQSTRWSAEGAQHVIVDLGKESEFDTVVMSFMNGNGRHYKLRMSISNDNEEYTTVFSGTSGGVTNDYEQFDVGECKARYLKIEGSGYDGGSWNSWTELAVAKKQ